MTQDRSPSPITSCAMERPLTVAVGMGARLPRAERPRARASDRGAPPMTALDGFGPRSWARPEATGFGRLPMSTRLVRPDVLLDGEWSFGCATGPRTCDRGPRGPTDGWASIEVPGCWTMQGFDPPQYTNIQMPFPGPPPPSRTTTRPASTAAR